MANSRINVSDAQKSEVHATTGDAETSPVAEDMSAVPLVARHAEPLAPIHMPRKNEPLTPDSIIVIDETDDGGPLVIHSDDPALNPPRIPRDPFPTDRKPEIDPPIED
jgi:hypothetical protein